MPDLRNRIKRPLCDLGRWLRSARESIRTVRANARTLGLLAAVQLWGIERCLSRGCADGLWRIDVAGISCPVIGRYGTSDILVFRQIFLYREHRWLESEPSLRAAQLIVDCGANVGYALMDLLRTLPRAYAIAVEPDESNFAILKRNLCGYRSRVHLIHAGLWSHKTRLVCVDRAFRDGGHWSRQVEEAAADCDVAIPAVTVGELLAMSGKQRIDLLKVDIEGAEVKMFAPGCVEWLDHTDAIAIELHNDSMFGNGTAAFHEAIDGKGFELKESGELTIAVRKQ